MDIQNVIQTIDRLFKNYNMDTRRFTVDYDEQSDGLYCNYVPYVNDTGYAVTNDLLYVGETSQEDLQRLKNYLNENKIKSRYGYDWFTYWGWEE